MSHAASAVQAVFRLDFVGRAFCDAVLWTDRQALAAADTAVCNDITFFGNRSIAQCIAFTENRIDTQIEIFNLCVFDTKDNANFAGIVGIDVGKIGLFFKD